MSQPVLPPALCPGDVVRLVAPSGPFDRGRFDRGVAVLRERGYVPRWRDDAFDTERYLAGSDDRRLRELHDAFADPEARAVWAIRGGYGAMRLLPGLSPDALLARPKVFVGFSDITALHAPLNRRGLVTFHGPVACRLAEEPPEVLEALWSLLEQPRPPADLAWPDARTVRPGTATGPLLGGNLSVLTRLLGTPFLPDLAGAVLFLEDVAERPYRLDRMITHLELAGVHERVAGVVVGQLTACDEPGGAYTGEEVVAERLARWPVPVAMGLPAGHGDRHFALPLGLPVELDADAGRLRWRGAAVGG